MIDSGPSESGRVQSCAEPNCPLGVEENGTRCGFHAEVQAPDTCESCGGPVQVRWYAHDDEFFILLDAPEPPGVWRCYCPPCDLEFWSDDTTDVTAPASVQPARKGSKGAGDE